MTSDQKQRSKTVEVQDHLRAPIGSVRKCVGFVPGVGRFEHEAKAFEIQLRSMTISQLEDALARQLKILSNPGLLKTLPDKGEKVRKRKEMIQELIDQRQKSLNEAVDLMKALSLDEARKVDIDEMEWKFGGGNLFRNLDPSSKQPLDSDDDSNEGDDTPLKDIANINAPSAESKAMFEKEAAESLLVPFAEKISHKSDELKPKARFIPFLSVDSKVTTPDGNITSRTHGLQRRAKPDRPIRDHKVEVMPIQTDEKYMMKAKEINLKESFLLEKEHNIKIFD